MGLASRRYDSFIPQWIGPYLGDSLWALMVFLGFGFLFQRKSTIWVAFTALFFSFGIELSQLYHAPWIDRIRACRLGGLVLGYGFLWSDLVCYTVGIMAGWGIEKLLFRNQSRTK